MSNVDNGWEIGSEETRMPIKREECDGEFQR